jgi:hypothetical protein
MQFLRLFAFVAAAAAAILKREDVSNAVKVTAVGDGLLVYDADLVYAVTRGVISLDRRRWNSRETTPSVFDKVNKRKITFRCPGSFNASYVRSLNRDSVMV